MDAEKAIAEMDGQSLNGANISVQWTNKDRPPKTFDQADECFKCKQTGHWARNCPRGNERRYF
jgi:hypothetical protein